ncbi:MAG: HD-GYP domain-containing protein, partial [Bacillota bacterium]
IGYKILRAADPYTRLSEYVLYHHERYDGMGYPEGLKGEAIPRISRIIAVVDAYEAMTSKRNYRNPLSKGKAVQELRAHAGTQFDPDITQVFIERVLNSKGA